MKSFLARCIVALFLVAEGADAAFIPHEGFLTDTETGLDWLNNAPLSGESYESVLNGFGGYINSGWRYASGAEIIQLVNSFMGQTCVLPGFFVRCHGSGPYASAYSLVELLGINVSFGDPPDPRATDGQIQDSNTTQISTQGMYDDKDGNSLVGVFAFSAVLKAPDDQVPHSHSAISGNVRPADEASGLNVSSFLVRISHVPEPGTFQLIALGVFLIIVLQRVRTGAARWSGDSAIARQGIVSSTPTASSP